ncbi:MAG: pyruvate-formate lyase [Herbinix sp.]|nr:pyruvate-formate lyase [Herbinix sp.]
MLNTEKVVLSPLYQKRFQGLHDDKLLINDAKINKLGSIDIDDHGFILFPDFKFEPKVNHKDGYVYGALAIGENFRTFLNQIPSYINKNSALATCWIGPLHNYMKVGIIPEDRLPQLEEIWKEYKILQSGFGGMNHLGPDIKIGLELGWGGLLKKVRNFRTFNHPADTSFYDGEEQLLLGIQEWIANHAKLARTLAEAEEEEILRENYMEIALMNEWLTENPPRTLREACQFIAHFQAVDRTYFGGGALSQLDEVLRPFYEKDVSEGIVTDEQAAWYIASLFFNDTHYSQIAGLTTDGSGDLTSRMSFLILDAMHYLHIPINLALRVHDQVNEELLRRSLAYTLEDGSGVDYSLNIGCEEGYAKNGFPVELGRLRAKVGCNWTALPGTEYPLQDVTRCNMASALVHAIEDLKASRERTLELLWDRFTYHIRIMLDSIKKGYDHHYEVVSRNTPELVLNLFMHGPIERGLNAAEGGVDNMSFCIDGIALATVADSFAAIEQRLVLEQRLTWEQLFDALGNNFKDAESIRLMMKNVKRFGSPDSLAEKWALKIRDYFVDYAKISTPLHNLRIIPGMFSHGDVFMYGKTIPATPNGRFDKDPISHSNEPDPGFARGIDSFSPSLKATAVAKVQPGLGNSAPLHLDIDKDMLGSEDGIDALIALIHTHNHMGGTLINLNCLTKKMLLEAHEDPSKYPDLVVRVTGYSAFFATLSKTYRQQIVDRFLS